MEKIFANEGQKKVKVFGQLRDQPRKTAFYSELADEHYGYSGTGDLKVHPLPKALKVVKERVEALLDAPFDSVLVNYYENGSKHIGAHRDDDAMKGMIASVSFGAKREFQIRDSPLKSDKFVGKERIISSIPLPSGSLFVMREGFQQEFKHSVPKRPSLTDGRINITFRQHSATLK